MAYTILVMPGEGVGPEVVAEGVRVLRAASEAHGIPLELETFEVGEQAFARTGDVLPPDVRAACDRSAGSAQAAILFGSVVDEPIGLLRKDYDLFANLRPVRPIPCLHDVSPLKADRVGEVDLLIVRELVSDIYYGKARTGGSGRNRWASQEMRYSSLEVARIVRVAFEQARARRQALTWVHKGNVIKGVHALWQEAMQEVQRLFPDVTVSDLLVDAAALHLVLHPDRFDVLLCPNLFGDILSDIGGAIVGSVGLLPSASINEAGFALYECVGGTAPDLAGRGLANPVGTILSVAMLCRYTCRNEAAAAAIEDAVCSVLATHRTSDINDGSCQAASTGDLGRLIADRVRRDAI